MVWLDTKEECEMCEMLLGGMMDILVDVGCEEVIWCFRSVCMSQLGCGVVYTRL